MKNKLCYVLLATLIAAPSLVTASSYKDITITGNVRIPEGIIRSKINSPLAKDASLDDLIKVLYATQLFKRIEAHVKAGCLIINVEENPIIESIVFRGNSAISTRDLHSIIGSKPLSILKPDQLNKDVYTMLDEYRKHGIFRTNVSWDTEELSPSKVRVIFKIQESPKSKIRAIDFTGNQVFSDELLRSVILSRVYSFLNFMSDAHYYVPDRMEADKAMLKDFYLRNGYMNFKIMNVSAEMADDSVYINFVVDEGPKYKIQSIKLKNDSIDGETFKELLSVVSVKAGDDFNTKMINDDLRQIIETLNNTGYFFAQAEPEYATNGNLIDLTYKISRGNKIYVNKVNIVGNEHTKDSVIRKQLALAEGDPFNRLKVETSKARLARTRFFSSADVDIVQVDSRYVDLNVDVVEQSTGSLKLSAGYSSNSGMIGILGYRDYNILGSGNEFYFSVEKSFNDFGGKLGLVKRFIGNNDSSVGINVFKQNSERKQSSFISNSIGLSLWTEIPMTESTSLSLRYALSDSDISIGAIAAPAIQRMLGNNRVSSVGYAIIYSGLDNGLLPSKGAYLKFSQDVAGLGGNAHFIRSEFTGVYFQPIFTRYFSDLIYKNAINWGNIFDYYNHQLRVAHNFFIGIEEIRGFAPSGIGPRDIKYDDALGGKNYISWSHQVSFPLAYNIEELAKFNLKGNLFVDLATLTGIDYSEPSIVDDPSLRASVGFGFSWITPFGAMSLDFGFPIMQGEYDKTQLVRFTLGNNF